MNMDRQCPRMPGHFCQFLLYQMVDSVERTNMDPTLMEQPYFHGLLPREDLPLMLRNRGDFLVRCTEPSKGQPRAYVLSMKAPATKRELKETVRHFIIRVEKGKFYIHQKLFDSITKMIAHYVTTGEALNVTAPETVIARPVARQDWELLHSEITVDKHIGEGAFGAVCLGKWTSRLTNVTLDCAIKQAKMDALNKEQIKEVMTEARVMRPLDHPNVVKLYGVAALQEPLMIVMEFCKQGALNSYLKKNPLTVEKQVEMCFGSACGIHYLHESGLLHRDIAARNCLFSENNVKIADFGLTKDGPVFDMDPAKPVPVKWMSPEAVQTTKYTYKADVWAYGVMCFEIFAKGNEPYMELQKGEIVKKVREGYRLQFPSVTPLELKYYFLHRVFASEQTRPTMGEIVSYFETSFGYTAPPLNVPQKNRTYTFLRPFESFKTIQTKVDYEYLESDLSTHYNPNNVYWYVMDLKADSVFKSRLRVLSSCFPNVIVPDTEFNMTSRGVNLNYAQYHCMEMMMDRQWRYVVLLENHDVLTKTNGELVQIFRAYNGANDVGALNLNTLGADRRKFAEINDFSFKALGLFQNDTLNTAEQTLAIAKSITASALTFEAVRHIFNTLNTTKLMSIMNSDNYEHESFTSSLNANEILNVPGGFTTECLDKKNIDQMVRFTKWGGHGCHSKRVRHGVCIFGMSDLRPRLMPLRQFTVNKMMPSIDFGAINCWHEHLFNRTHVQRNTTVDTVFYSNIPYVRWHNQKMSNTLNRTTFAC
ncbi:unnamed protein product [Bursaphelenchus okinawaensis]|uniref:Tyrosine-protein kinase n=1 Tax=Bursaphelenchus okinawaensis TaxID=465554 RepID=A0A811JQK9_9BILA|nr:unnamed protein product [Bursaphelenchus okinawaensis]CAG9078241.1 unnamed protein product [Bursaphelenchus okinawaensis]